MMTALGLVFAAVGIYAAARALHRRFHDRLPLDHLALWGGLVLAFVGIALGVRV